MTVGYFGAFLDRAAREPDRTAFVIADPGGDERALTCGRLLAAARRWAAAYRSRGARAGDVILISLALSPDLIEAFLGASWIGCVPSLMPYPSAKQDPVLFWSSHDLLFGRLDGRLIVASAEHRAEIAANIGSVRMSVVTPLDVTGLSDADAGAPHSWKGSDLAVLQHSSGTTGLKKGVMLGLDVIAAQVESYAAAIDIGQDDTIVSWLPLYHDMGFVACLLLPLTLGVKSVLIDPFAWLVDPLSLFRCAERHAAAFAWMPNFAFSHLVNAADGDDRRFDLSTLRGIIDCSETCRPATLATFRDTFADWGLSPGAPATCYAMAETVFAISQSRIGEAPRVLHLDREALDAGRVVRVEPSQPSVDVVSSGAPIRGVELLILDDAGAEAATDRIGQIAVRAPFLFRGYHLEPGRTEAAFSKGFYLTGDLGFRLGDDLFVLGRRDDLLILLGRNAFANEIETILGGVPGIRAGRILAMGLANDDLGSQDLVIVAEPSEATIDAASVRSAMRVRLESVLGLSPKKIVFVEPGWLVKSTSGKISRADNRRKYTARFGVPSKG